MRFSTAIFSRSLFCLVLVVTLTVALRGFGGLFGNGQGYEKCTTLAEAVELVRGQLVQDGKPEYAALLTEARVRAAMQTAIEKTDRNIDDQEKLNAGTKEYWQNIAKPVYLQIIETGKWPANCAFDGFYGVTDKRGISYDGLGLRLTISTPQDKFKGYGLPILDLYFGRGGSS
jgi:hypothetical protein